MEKQHKSIYISDVTYERLKIHQHPGQSFDGVIVEMLDYFDKANPQKEAAKKPDPTSSPS